VVRRRTPRPGPARVPGAADRGPARGRAPAAPAAQLERGRFPGGRGLRGPPRPAAPAVRRGAVPRGLPRGLRIPQRSGGAQGHLAGVARRPGPARRRRPARHRRPPRQPGRRAPMLRHGLPGAGAGASGPHLRDPGNIALRRRAALRAHGQELRHTPGRGSHRAPPGGVAGGAWRRGGQARGLLPRHRALPRVPDRFPPAPLRRGRPGASHPVRAVGAQHPGGRPA